MEGRSKEGFLLMIKIVAHWVLVLHSCNPVILATGEAEIRRIEVQSQPGK
jgi:hypothetical protein